MLQPQKTLEEFDEAEYECLILPGCSQPIYALRDKKLIGFLRKFRDSNYPIGAICSGPLILAKAQLLKGCQFITSTFMDLMVRLPSWLCMPKAYLHRC